MTEESQYSLLDWENDQCLLNPTPLDIRVEKLLEDRMSEPDGQGLVIDESDAASTPSTFSVDTPASTPSTFSVDTPSSVENVESEIKQPEVAQQVNRPIQNCLPSSSKVTSSLNVESVLQPKKSLKRPPPPPPPKRQLPSWETPLQKMKRYQERRERYSVRREAYLTKYKNMKTIIRLQKAGPEALPPREENIKLFDEVS